MQIQMKDGTTLVGAKNRFGHDIRCYDDGFGPLWVYRTTTGVTGIVRAMTWEDAYDCVLDDILVPISPEDVPEAHGFHGDNATAEFQTALEEAGMGEADYPELQEGYAFQPNVKGTGIVSLDLNGEALDPLTTELVRDLEIRLEIRSFDAA